MKLYEKILKDGYDKVDQEIDLLVPDNIISIKSCDNGITASYYFDSFIGFPVCSARLSVMESDIHNDIPCGIFEIDIVDADVIDTISYLARFTKEEFEMVKKFT